MKPRKHPLVLPPSNTPLRPVDQLSYLSPETGRWRILASRTRKTGIVPALAWVGQMYVGLINRRGLIGVDVDKSATLVTDEYASFAWVATCTCKTHGECPASRALDKACELWDAASLVRLPPYERKSK